MASFLLLFAACPLLLNAATPSFMDTVLGFLNAELMILAINMRIISTEWLYLTLDSMRILSDSLQIGVSGSVNATKFWSTKYMHINFKA